MLFTLKIYNDYVCESEFVLIKLILSHPIDKKLSKSEILKLSIR